MSDGVMGSEVFEDANRHAPPLKADGGGLRYNSGKVKVELLPPEWELALGIVMTRGAEKYEMRNWERGMSWGTMLGCARRHMLRFALGERHDRDTGCHHLAMAAWNLLALMTYDIREIGTNDMVAWAKEMDELAKVLAIEPGPDFKAAVAARQLAALADAPPRA